MLTIEIALFLPTFILSSLMMPRTALHLSEIKILPPGSQLDNQKAIIPPQ